MRKHSGSDAGKSSTDWTDLCLCSVCRQTSLHIDQLRLLNSDPSCPDESLLLRRPQIIRRPDGAAFSDSFSHEGRSTETKMQRLGLLVCFIIGVTQSVSLTTLTIFNTLREKRSNWFTEIRRVLLKLCSFFLSFLIFFKFYIITFFVLLQINQTHLCFLLLWFHSGHSDFLLFSNLGSHCSRFKLLNLYCLVTQGLKSFLSFLLYFSLHYIYLRTCVSSYFVDYALHRSSKQQTFELFKVLPS